MTFLDTCVNARFCDFSLLIFLVRFPGKKNARKNEMIGPKTKNTKLTKASNQKPHNKIIISRSSCIIGIGFFFRIEIIEELLRADRDSD